MRYNTIKQAVNHPSCHVLPPPKPRGRDAQRSQKEILDAALRRVRGARPGRRAHGPHCRRCSGEQAADLLLLREQGEPVPRRAEAAYENIRSEEQQLNLTQVEPLEAIRRLIAFTWNYYLAHPEFLTLLNSENLHRARHLKNSTKIAAMHSPLVATLADVLERGHKSSCSARGSTRCSCTSRSPPCRTSTSATPTRCRPSSIARCWAAKAKVERLSHMTDLVLGYLVRD